jgi:hypothetical protein
MPSPTGLTQPKHAVFKQFDLGKDPRLPRFCSPQSLACAIDGGGVGLKIGSESQVLCARDDAGFMRLAPFEFRSSNLPSSSRSRLLMGSPPNGLSHDPASPM